MDSHGPVHVCHGLRRAGNCFFAVFRAIGITRSSCLSAGTVATGSSFGPGKTSGLFFKSDLCQSGRMKMQVLGSIALMTFAAPMLFAASPTPPPAQSIGVNLALRDVAVKPGDDFDEYANGGWRKTTEIPADRSSTGVGFEVFQKAEKRNADLVREAGAGKPAAGTPQRLIADYYAAYMDTDGHREARSRPAPGEARQNRGNQIEDRPRPRAGPAASRRYRSA